MDDARILLAHGGGGAMMRELLDEVILPMLGTASKGLPDASPIPGTDDLLMTTDAFVIKPLFFRGGDIGRLSVCGTVNDLAVSGAQPLALTLSLILEEGLPVETLRRVMQSAADTARECGVPIVAGDTKVVARGEADGLFITTAGVGRRRVSVSPAQAQPGDAVLINGGIAEHGIAVVSQREGLAFETPVVSDAAPVWPWVMALIDAGIPLHVMRDPTRGGVAMACVEIAEDSDVTIALEETALPVRPEVRAACDMLGFDPLTVANEGKVLVFTPEAFAERALEVMRRVPGGERAARIGAVRARGSVGVVLRTRHGGERLVDMPYGEELPRIC